ncbi:DeoR/GlpR family DNA-binding transcription regulator [Lacihabitans soyangensis]|uniref:DeoR/GlpR transcriptional regulator n=1 Tax=Lacihabitans soyangensis TaxID=869394 RepID=A0AAE3H1B8_9BACT|nr:DeoR/GlpR family DNA-binding transcription regulator [Lacihabitans soyangensis]MCP9762194.1 DeoR/GlpR transcriptional regulator [Lacihabitans soyangensis]
MNFQLRKHKILEILAANDSADVADLASEIGTSEITIRRDLNTLANQGLLTRTHGGAIRNDFDKPKIAFFDKNDVNADAKEEIAQKASELIKAGEVIFLDCGSTVFRMCKYLKNRKIKVVTNSIPVLLELLNSEVQVNFAGGEIDALRQAAHGPIATEHLARYKAEKAFVGVDGISIANGLSANSEKEAEMTMTMANNAKETYFLCDSSKFETVKYLSFSKISSVKNIVTDKKISIEVKQKYIDVGISLF